ncbi:hypothetical protein HAX54_007996 [Datura stramonium]|uniref:Uncharacterized protein n=1 Tax=Datura stramonium TaxID=4076 RepID=A0ABS8TF57_DATST|nr:hypothetical protein [Datura stramonium]
MNLKPVRRGSKAGSLPGARHRPSNAMPGAQQSSSQHYGMREAVLSRRSGAHDAARAQHGWNMFPTSTRKRNFKRCGLSVITLSLVPSLDWGAPTDVAVDAPTWALAFTLVVRVLSVSDVSN